MFESTFIFAVLGEPEQSSIGFVKVFWAIADFIFWRSADFTTNQIHAFLDWV